MSKVIKIDYDTYYALPDDFDLNYFAFFVRLKKNKSEEGFEIEHDIRKKEITFLYNTKIPGIDEEVIDESNKG